MINMLIVDDELLMRRGLSFIPWEKAGVCLIGTASSGMEALEFIKEKRYRYFLPTYRCRISTDLN